MHRAFPPGYTQPPEGPPRREADARAAATARERARPCTGLSHPDTPSRPKAHHTAKPPPPARRAGARLLHRPDSCTTSHAFSPSRYTTGLRTLQNVPRPGPAEGAGAAPLMHPGGPGAGPPSAGLTPAASLAVPCLPSPFYCVRSLRCGGARVPQTRLKCKGLRWLRHCGAPGPVRGEPLTAPGTPCPCILAVFVVTCRGARGDGAGAGQRTLRAPRPPPPATLPPSRACRCGPWYLARAVLPHNGPTAKPPALFL